MADENDLSGYNVLEGILVNAGIPTKGLRAAYHTYVHRDLLSEIIRVNGDRLREALDDHNTYESILRMFHQLHGIHGVLAVIYHYDLESVEPDPRDLHFRVQGDFAHERSRASLAGDARVTSDIIAGPYTQEFMDANPGIFRR